MTLALRNNIFKPSANLLDDWLIDEWHTHLQKTESGYKLEIPLAGFKKENIEVGIEKGVLKVKAHRGEKGEIKFEQSYYLPKDVNTDNVKASHEDGLLTLNFNSNTKTYKITIK
jgi:HSP20 family molecular chaperone IbpA